MRNAKCEMRNAEVELGRERPLRNVCPAATRGASHVAATVRILDASARQSDVGKRREHGRFWLSRPPCPQRQHSAIRTPHSAFRIPQSAFRNPHSAAPLTPTYGREPLRNVCKAAIRGKSDVAATVRLLHASARQNGVRKQREHGRFWLSRPPPRSQAALNAECEMRNAKCGMRKSNWDARGHCAMCARPPPAARRMLPPRYEFWTRRQGRTAFGSGANTADSGSQGHHHAHRQL